MCHATLTASSTPVGKLLIATLALLLGQIGFAEY